MPGIIDIRFSTPSGARADTPAGVRALKFFEKVKKRMNRPFASGGYLVAAHVMRNGSGSVSEQFRTTTYHTRGGARVSWKKTKAFGRLPAPKRTLHRTGSLEAAWTARGSGSFTAHTGTKVVIGVDSRRFPQADRLQSISATLTRPRKKGAQGRSRMHWFLGMRFGVWISDRRLNMGLRVDPRRLGINPEMMKRVSVAMREFIRTGKASGAKSI